MHFIPNKYYNCNRIYIFHNQNEQFYHACFSFNISYISPSISLSFSLSLSLSLSLSHTHTHSLSISLFLYPPSSFFLFPQFSLIHSIIVLLLWGNYGHPIHLFISRWYFRWCYQCRGRWWFGPFLV